MKAAVVFKSILYFLLLALICPNLLRAESVEFGSVPVWHEKTIVIDPGHGGNDIGAKGPDKTYEKSITLTLAKILKRKFADKSRVVLTRDGDYKMNIFERAAVANHEKADIFISLHTGGSFLHNSEGIAIYYYSGLEKIDSDRKSETMPNRLSPVIWNTIQNSHIENSRFFAETLNKEFAELFEIPVKIFMTQMVVLSGVNSPAVLIEIGFLTNPTEEIKLCDKLVLLEYAKYISIAVDKFFKTTTKS